VHTVAEETAVLLGTLTRRRFSRTNGTFQDDGSSNPQAVWYLKLASASLF
jgi:hypothetical protein